MKPPFSYVPLLPVFAAQVTGVMICYWFESDYTGLLLLIFAIGFLMMKKFHGAVFVGAALIGWCSYFVSKSDTDIHEQLPDCAVLEATVETAVENSRGRSINVEADRQMLDDSTFVKINPIKIRLTIAPLFPDVAPGDRIVFKGNYNSIYRMTDLPDEFDMSEVLIRKGISATSFIQSEDLKVVGHDSGFIWWLRRYQSKVMNVIYRSGLNDATADFLGATIMGDQSSIDAETRKLFSSTGQAHVLALSGAHVVIIASILSLMLFPLTFFGFHQWRLIITIVALWVFAIVTGLMPSVTRSAIMTTVVIGAYLLKRRNSSMNALFAAAILIITFDPNAMFQAGFQLSFSAVASILLLSKRLNPVSSKKHFFHKLTAVILLPCVAVLGTFSLSAYYFHIFPVYFFLAAIPVSFIFTFIISGGVAVIFLEIFGVQHDFVNSVVEWLYSLAMKIMEITMGLPNSVIDNIYLDEFTVIIIMCIPVAMAGWLAYRRIAWGFGCMALVVAAVLIQNFSAPNYPAREMFVTRETVNTNIIIREGKQMLLISTVNPTMLDDELDKCNFKYAEYMGRRGVDSIQAVVDTISTSSLAYSGRRLIAGELSFIIINGDDDLRQPPFKPTYALICRGFKGEIEDVVNIVMPETVLLSYDLHRRRHDRYLATLREMEVDVLSVRENGGLWFCF